MGNSIWLFHFLQDNNNTKKSENDGKFKIHSVKMTFRDYS